MLGWLLLQAFIVGKPASGTREDGLQDHSFQPAKQLSILTCEGLFNVADLLLLRCSDLG